MVVLVACAAPPKPVAPSPVVATKRAPEDVTHSRQDRTSCEHQTGDVVQLEAACKQGTTEACFTAARLYACGRQVPLDSRKAVALDERACQLGDPDGCFDAAALLTDLADATPAELAHSAALFRDACHTGNQPGCSNYAAALALGRGVPLDLAAAKELFDSACARGNQPACLSFAMMFIEGNAIVPRDLARGVTLATASCDHGNANACNAVAGAYFDGFDASSQEAAATRAAPFLQRACDGGSLRGCANLGQLYANGLGVATDRPRAAALLERACKGGIVAACAMAAKLR